MKNFCDLSLFSSILSASSGMAAKETLFLSIVGIYSLFPLLHPTNLLVVKLTLYLSYVLLQFVSFQTMFNNNVRFNLLERFYCWGFGPLFIYAEVVHQRLPWAMDRLPFLPLLLTSVYCALGVTYFWLTVTWRFVSVRVAVAAGASSSSASSTVTTKTVKSGNKKKDEEVQGNKNKAVDKVARSVDNVAQFEKAKAPAVKKAGAKKKVKKV